MALYRDWPVTAYTLAANAWVALVRASFASAVAQSAARPVDLTVNMRQADAAAPTPITNQIDVHVPAQPAPQVSNHVTVQPADVKVVAESAAPIVNITNDVQPAPVTVNNTHPARAVQTVERDANDEIVSTTTTYHPE